jgi:hypothetical protein
MNQEVQGALQPAVRSNIPIIQSNPVKTAVHLYTLTSTKPVAIAINSKTKGKKMAVTPMIARGSCSQTVKGSSAPQAATPHAASVADVC